MIAQHSLPAEAIAKAEFWLKAFFEARVIPICPKHRFCVMKTPGMLARIRNIFIKNSVETEWRKQDDRPDPGGQTQKSHRCYLQAGYVPLPFK